MKAERAFAVSRGGAGVQVAAPRAVALAAPLVASPAVPAMKLDEAAEVTAAVAARESPCSPS